MSRPVRNLSEPQVGQPLSLPLELDVPQPRPAAKTMLPAVRVGRAEQWLGIYLPELVLESHIGVAQRNADAAVVAEQSGKLMISAVTATAAQQGVASGMTLAAAMALLPGLKLYTFFPERVVACHRVLAEYAHRFTPTVVLDGPDILLLEVAPSLRLFGGLAVLLERLMAALEQQGHEASFAVAPTPRAAMWLARSRPGVEVTDIAGLDSALRELPLTTLGWPDDVIRRFAAMGIRELGDCRRLPRAGFAKRFGPARLLELDRAYGTARDPRSTFRMPERFESRLELTAEIGDKTRLCGAAAVLLERLARFARKRQRCVRTMRFGFYAIDAPATMRTLRPGILAQEIGHWQRLLELDLEPVEFPAPTVLIELVAAEFEPLRTRSGVLPFDGQPAAEVQAAATGLLLERLRARLGRAAVRSLRLTADHRPERAMQLVAPEAAALSTAVGLSPWRELALPVLERLCLQRPLWLLPEPQPLAALFGANTAVTLQHGPERIESGWWDLADSARDYYIAQAGDALAWLYRERQSSGSRWYVHGLFG
ncbi:MAG: DNA polymerase Y family protein [Pseudomonadota bacterium]